MTNHTDMTAHEREERNYEMMVAEEELILHAQILIKRAMRERGVSQKALAERLGVGASYISQMLGSSARNLTLRTIARVMHVLEQKATVVIDEYETQLDAGSEETTNSASSSLADLIAGSRPSSVWGNVVSLPPRTGKGRRKGEAKAFAEFEAHEQEVAIAA